jgi:hypothetical protein
MALDGCRKIGELQRKALLERYAGQNGGDEEDE